MPRTYEQTTCTLLGQQGRIRSATLFDTSTIGTGAVVELRLFLEPSPPESTPIRLKGLRELAAAWNTIEARMTGDAVDKLSRLVVAASNISGHKMRNCLFPERVPHFHEPEFRGQNLIFWALVEIGVDVQLSWSTLDGSLRELSRHETSTEP